MNKKEYWQAHVAKNPKLADETKEIQISVKMLKLLLSDAHEKGYQHAGDIKKEISDAFARSEASRTATHAASFNFADIFKSKK